MNTQTKAAQTPLDLDGREFYNLAQDYRFAPVENQAHVCDTFEAMKHPIREVLADNARLLALLADARAAFSSLLAHEHAAAYALASRPETEVSFRGACEQGKRVLARIDAAGVTK